MTALALAPDMRIGYKPAAAAGVDRTIRVSTAITVLAVAGVAAYVSYWHAYAVVCAHGETGVTARLDGHDQRARLRQLDGQPLRRAAPASGPRPGPLAARTWHRRDAGRQHGPGLVPRASRRGHRGPRRRSASWAAVSSGLDHPDRSGDLDRGPGARTTPASASGPLLLRSLMSDRGI